MHRSYFFRAALHSVWLKDPTAPVDLQDEDPEVFSTYLKCVYFGTEAIQVDIQNQEIEDQPGDKGRMPGPDAFELANIAEDEDEDVENTAAYCRIGMLAKLYILADKLRDPITTNIVMELPASTGP